MRPYPINWLALILLLLSANSWSGVASVATAPATKNVPLGRASAIPIRWLATDSSPAGPVTVSSTLGKFLDVKNGSIQLGTINTTISRSYTSTGAPQVISLNETVAVPAHVIVRAHQLGLSSFVYQRSFQPMPVAGGDPTGIITLNITSPAASGFAISRLALHYQDDSLLHIGLVDETLYVFAEVSTTGSGLLRGTWEVAAPSSTGGQPLYRPLATLSRYATVAQELSLSSPRLPTDQLGTYLVRLRITEPGLAFEAPVIRYAIRQPGAKETVPAPLVLRAPPARAHLSKTTRFQWQKIKQAAAYRLEFYDTRESISSDDLPSLGSEDKQDPEPEVNTPAVTGAVVPGKQTSTVLAANTRQHLHSGRNYRWRVLAIDNNGAVIAASTLRQLHVP